MMANEEDYEEVIFSDFSDFLSEHEKGKAVVDPNIGWSSDPILKINLSRPSKIPPPDPTVANAYPQPRWFPDTKVCASATLCASVFRLGLLYSMFCDV